MNITEKMLTVDDAYDTTYDFLNKYYRKTKSEDLIIIVSDMPFFADGISANPSTQEDWKDAVNNILNKDSNIPQNFKSAKKKLSIKQSYRAMINFLETYDYFKEIVDIVNEIKLSNNGMPSDPKNWSDWVESVNKILNQKPRIRPLLFFINTELLTINDTYEIVADYLSKFYEKTKCQNIGSLLNNIKYTKTGNIINNSTWKNWNKSTNKVLNKNDNTPQNHTQRISAKETYDALIDFLNKYCQNINSKDEITILINNMKLPNNEPCTLNEAWDSFTESVNKTINKYREF